MIGILSMTVAFEQVKTTRKVRVEVAGESFCFRLANRPTAGYKRRS